MGGEDPVDPTGSADPSAGERFDGGAWSDGGADPVPHVDGQVLLLAAAKASVSADRLPSLVASAQTELGPRIEEYRREFECVYEDDRRAVFLVPRDHWEGLGDRLDFAARETSAVRRVHNEQLRRLGGEGGRREEFETALDIRDAVVVGVAAVE